MYVRENAPWSISHNDIYDMRQTSQGDLFFATFGGGLAKLSETDENGKARSFAQLATIVLERGGRAKFCVVAAPLVKTDGAGKDDLTVF